MPKNVLLIHGGIYHDYPAFAAAVKPVLEQAGYAVEATDDLSALTHLDQGKCDIVAMYTGLVKRRPNHNDTNPESLPPAETESLCRWVQAGGAFLSLHGTICTGDPNPALEALIGGRFLGHPPIFSFMVYPLSNAHPIIDGVDAFSVRDELYRIVYDPSIEIHMASTYRGVLHPQVWSKRDGQGRVVHILMGHDEPVWNAQPYRQLILQSLAWLTN